MKKLIIAASCLSVLLAGCAVKSRCASATVFAMDTVVNIEAETDSKTLNEAVDICRKIEDALSRTKQSSEIFRLNRDGQAAVSDDTAYILKTALKFCEMTGGRFDITVGSLSDVWNFSDNTLPDEESVKNAVSNVDYKKLKINCNTVETGGAKIDLGAAAKGFAADKIRDFLKSKGVSTATLNLGGNVLVMGDDYSVVAIKSPFKPSEISARLKVKNTSVVTSGTYERYIEANGKKYHHILNTKTGYPVESDIVSATVISENSLEADILSTICLIYGSSAALELINSYNTAEAVLITADGSIYISSGIYCEDGFYRL